MLNISKSDIIRALKMEDITLYICIYDNEENYVSWSLIEDQELGVFKYKLFPPPTWGDDILLESKSGLASAGETDCYEIWKVIRIIVPCVGELEGEMVLKYMNSICYIPGEH